MRIGISPFAGSRAAALEVAARATSGGLDTLWLGDGFLANPNFGPWSGALEPCCHLAWLAGRFPSARIGLTAAVLPLRDPDWLVKQAATLDQLTGGNMVLVMTPGFWPQEFAARGLDFAERGRIFDERLAVVRRRFAELHAAATSTVTPDTVTGAQPAELLAPFPHRPEGPPLWLAGAAATMAKALHLGLPFQASRLTPDELAPLAARWFDDGGRTLAHRVRVQVGEQVPTGHQLDWHAVVGPPSFLAEQLDRFRQLGVADLSLVPGQDDTTALATVDALIETVLPQLAT